FLCHAAAPTETYTLSLHDALPISTCGPLPLPTSSPLKSIGASSFSPSPITTTPSIETVSSIRRIASTAAWSALSLSPRPIQRARSEEHTSELQSLAYLVCRLLLEK